MILSKVYETVEGCPYNIFKATKDNKVVYFTVDMSPQEMWEVKGTVEVKNYISAGMVLQIKSYLKRVYGIIDERTSLLIMNMSYERLIRHIFETDCKFWETARSFYDFEEPIGFVEDGKIICIEKVIKYGAKNARVLTCDIETKLVPILSLIDKNCLEGLRYDY